jgi:hypothetical protein
MSDTWRCFSQLQGAFVGMVLVVASCCKLLSPLETVPRTVLTMTLRRLGIGTPTPHVAAWRLAIALEVAIGLCLLVVPVASISGSVASVFFVSATLVVLWGVRHQRNASCGCFGGLDRVSSLAVARAFSLTVLSVAYTVTALPWWHLSGTRGEAIAIVISLLCCETVLLVASSRDLRRGLQYGMRVTVARARARIDTRAEQRLLLQNVADAPLWSALQILPSGCKWSRPYSYKGWSLCDAEISGVDVGNGPEAGVLVVGRSLEVVGWSRMQLVRNVPTPMSVATWDSIAINDTASSVEPTHRLSSEETLRQTM